MEPINKVLASTAQAFTTAEQLQARTNIDAQKSITFNYSGSTITAIDGSAIAQSGALTEVVHDDNLSGSGTSASPLGLASEITLSSTGLPYINTINSYSMYMHDASSTSYVGLGYNYFRDSAGGETYIHTDHITIADSGTCTLTAKPESVEFFNGNDLDRFASYNLSGVVLSSNGVRPVTSRLKDDRLSFYESGRPSAYYDRTGLQFGRTADVLTNLNSALKLSYDIGGNLESTTYSINGFTATTYTPTGTNQDIGIVATHGISGVNSFGDYKIWDSWNSSKRAQMGNNGDEKSVLDIYIGYNNGTAELYPAYIGFYNPFDGSAFIYQSSIAYWNGKLDSLQINYGLSGNGTSGSPLGVTACSGKFEGLHSDYFYALTSRDLMFSSYDKDNSQPEAKTVFNEYGMRMTSYNTAGNASSVITLQDDGYRFENAANSSTSRLNSTGLTFTVGEYPNESSEVVDTASIRRWNSYSASNWAESGNPLSTGFGGNQVTAASQYNDGAGNWAARTVRMSGLPDQTMYGFQSKPVGTGTYGVNQAGAFVAVPQSKYFTYLFHETGAYVETFDIEIFPTGLTADARLDFVNLCSAASANVKTDTFHGNTANINPGESATMWYIATADIWTDGYNPVPV